MRTEADSVEVKYCPNCHVPHVRLFQNGNDQPYATFSIDEELAEMLRDVMDLCDEEKVRELRGESDD